MRKYFTVVSIALAFTLLAAACSSSQGAVDGYCRTESEQEINPVAQDPPLPEGTETTDCYLGLSTDDATELADSSDRPWRVVSEDGEDFAVTLDFVETRLNFTVVDDEITDVALG